jgi:DNA-nicking Smr family endonuclease
LREPAVPRAVRHALSPHADGADSSDAQAHLRPGMGPDVLRRLRRLEWRIDNELSVRRLTQAQAHEALDVFLRECLERGDRCVRVVHGKGVQSPNREPVLKGKVRAWLAQRDEVLAFCEAAPAEGGSGALLVLLKR